jgi:hypothetical protein
MRPLFLFSALLSMLSTLSNFAAAQNTATTTLTANPTTITVGGTVALAATVRPDKASGTGTTIAGPTGTITFLDGSTPLSSSPVALTSNGYTSATFPQIFGTPDPKLTAQQSVVGELPGDLNGDGVQDLLIYNYTSPQYSVQAFTSDGKGGYTPSAVQEFSLPPSPGGPSVVADPQLIDVNGDGKVDLLWGLVVAYGNGDGTFAQAVPVSFLASGFVTSYAADLNRDGKTDILAVPVITGNPFLGNPVQFALTVFLNQGGGAFASAGTFPVAPPTSGNFVQVNFFAPVVVDLNGDGKPDLVTQNETIGATQTNGVLQVDVLLNNGNGTFGSPMPVTIPDPPNYTGGPWTYETASGDVNGDGKQDLILTLADTAANVAAIVLLGNGDGTFQAPSFLTLQSGPGLSSQTPAIAVQDFNLDGKPDLIFGNGELALGDGKGGFVLSSPLFPFQLSGTGHTEAYPLLQIDLPGNLSPSLVYSLPIVTPPAATVFTPHANSSAAFTASSLAVGTHTITARYSGDANYAADTSASIAVTVNQTASTIAATSSANPSFAGQSVTLTAQVTSGGPTPTGNVTFTSGSTMLASVALSGGSAVYTTSSFTSTQTITVSYSGDTNTQASSTSISQVVNAAFNTAPGGSGSTTLTVKAGQMVSAPINITGAAGFSGAVTFACSGLPANAACSFSPATITVSGTPAVSTLLSVNSATTTTASLLRPGLGAYGLAFAGLLLFWPARRSRHRTWALLLCAIAFAMLGLNGCSNSSGPAPAAQTAAGSYNFTVTASSGNLQAKTAYTLVVQ